MATALMEIARKVIVLDLETTEPKDLYGIAAVVTAVSLDYWLVMALSRFDIGQITKAVGQTKKEE